MLYNFCEEVDHSGRCFLYDCPCIVTKVSKPWHQFQFLLMHRQSFSCGCKKLGCMDHGRWEILPSPLVSKWPPFSIHVILEYYPENRINNLVTDAFFFKILRLFLFFSLCCNIQPTFFQFFKIFLIPRSISPQQD